MNEEEKEAIENLKTYIKLVINKNYCDCNELNVISNGNYCDGSKNVAQAIETVLNLLEKKDTLIHTMQAEFERLEDLEDNTDMLKIDLEKKDKEIQFQKEINKTEQDRHKKTEKSLKGQLEKKDKIINEMAKYIVEIDKYTCINCIKQYFERKVENGH